MNCFERTSVPSEHAPAEQYKANDRCLMPIHCFHCLQNMPLQALTEIIEEATISTAERMQRLEQQLRDTQAKLAAAEGAIKVS